MRRALVTLAAAAFAVTGLAATPAAAYADSTCAEGQICFWTGQNFTGAKEVVPASALAGMPVYGCRTIDQDWAGSPTYSPRFRSAKNRIATPGYAAALAGGGVCGNIEALPYGADVASFGSYGVANQVRRVTA